MLTAVPKALRAQVKDVMGGWGFGWLAMLPISHLNIFPESVEPSLVTDR